MLRLSSRKSINVTLNSLEFLKQIKEDKGFHSIEELIISCVKVCEQYRRSHILSLAEPVLVKTASSEEEMLVREGILREVESEPFKQTDKITGDLFKGEDEE